MLEQCKNIVMSIYNSFQIVNNKSSTHRISMQILIKEVNFKQLKWFKMWIIINKINFTNSNKININNWIWIKFHISNSKKNSKITFNYYNIKNMLNYNLTIICKQFLIKYLRNNNNKIEIQLINFPLWETNNNFINEVYYICIILNETFILYMNYL